MRGGKGLSVAVVLLVTGTLLVGCTGGSDPCDQVSATEEQITAEWQKTKERLQAQKENALEGEAPGYEDVWADIETATESSKAVREYRQGLRAASVRAVERLAILAQQHPDCFTVKERVEIESNYRQPE